MRTIRTSEILIWITDLLVVFLIFLRAFHTNSSIFWIYNLALTVISLMFCLNLFHYFFSVSSMIILNLQQLYSCLPWLSLGYWVKYDIYLGWKRNSFGLLRSSSSGVQLNHDGTHWRTGGEVKGKLANGVGSQYPSQPRNMVYPALLPLMRTPRLPVVDWTDAPADLNGIVRFAERQNLVSARVPSRFKRSLLRGGSLKPSTVPQLLFVDNIWHLSNQQAHF